MNESGFHVGDTINQTGPNATGKVVHNYRPHGVELQQLIRAAEDLRDHLPEPERQVVNDSLEALRHDAADQGALRRLNRVATMAGTVGAPLLSLLLQVCGNG
ncbi:hypothetical protein [Streptomyces griseoruber]|uniref:Uncharacterized protein n=1 Tax=Streptomyces griseoruber TaxID=1943 RepID=A0A101SLR1_9ACTN|nr:hypothetical protein [Streptomyces griseoruber]KUN76252.1 hypothetical protein AQJ64_38645 [Streptomyces griseoruber]